MNGREKLNDENKQTATEAGEDLGAVSNFNEHMRRTKAERVQRFANLALELNKSEEKNMSESLENMTPETALKILQHINSQLRNDKITKKSEIYGDEMHRMTVGNLNLIGGGQDLIAPEPDLQRELFGEYFDAVKKIEDKDKKALLAYYAINNLHLFSDGNGRTSRAVYLLLKNGDLSNADSVVSHNNEFKIRIDDRIDGDDGSGRENFISENKIRPVEQIDAVANLFLQEKMEKDRILDDNFKGKTIYIDSVRKKDDLSALMMLAKNRQGLSNQESKSLNYAISDNAWGIEYSSSLSGLTMATMLQRKELSSKVTAMWLKDDNRLPIRINFEKGWDTQEEVDDFKDVFADWSLEDYKETLKVYREIKKKQNEIVIRFFTEDVKFDDGENVAEWAMGE